MRRFALISAVLPLVLLALSCSKMRKAPDSILRAEPNTELESFVENLQGRDSILIADHVRFGAMLPGIPDDVEIILPEDARIPYLDIVKGWTLDTLERFRRDSLRNLRASLTLTTLEEGEYLLPAFDIAALHADGSADTLHFSGQDILVCTLPVDTATFVIHPLKPQRTIPVTPRERIPYRLGLFGFILLCVAVWFIVKHFRRHKEVAAHVDPPHIVALRKLDGYRGARHLEAKEQKTFYSGVTDALREYISARYGIGALEMTTAEIMQALSQEDIPDDLKAGLKELLEDADFVKFAKAVFDDEHNSKVLPFGVRFVTSTYEEQLMKEEGKQ